MSLFSEWMTSGADDIVVFEFLHKGISRIAVDGVPFF